MLQVQALTEALKRKSCTR